MIKFLRTTHYKNGKPKSFSNEANSVWDNTVAGFVGHMLDPKEPKPLKELITDINKYVHDYNENSLSNEQVAYGLILLLENKMACLIEE